MTKQGERKIENVEVHIPASGVREYSFTVTVVDRVVREMTKVFTAPNVEEARLQAEEETWDTDNGWTENLDAETITETYIASVERI